MSQPIAARDSEEIYGLLARSGIGMPAEIRANLQQGKISINGAPAAEGDPIGIADQLLIGKLPYRIEASANSRHLLVLANEAIPERVQGRRMVQCGYHKCLTMYFRKVFGKTFNSWLTAPGSYQHFFHRSDEFYRRCENYNLSSLSGHAIDLDRFDDVLLTRFIRDPRDLLVSGYFYHKRSAETWCDLVNPEDSDWQVVNGKVPERIPAGMSFAQYLNQVSLEEGLLAEIEFRQFHFDSMMAWPENDARVRLFHYEDLVGNEVAVYNQMFEFYGFSALSKLVGRHYARKYRADKQQTRSAHIRNASSGQWRKYFSAKVSRQFDLAYADLLDSLGYASR